MVGFVHNHPDRPFVMGSMFHGKVGLGGGTQNHLKSITTRSGCTIIFDDTDNKGSITVKDPSGNTWYMDGSGNIEVTAPKNITLNAGENITMSAGMNIISTAGENVNTSAGMNISESAGLNYTTTAGGMMMQNAILDYSLIAANITEIAQGNRESKAKVINENAQDKESAVSGNNAWHTENNFENNSGESSNMH